MKPLLTVAVAAFLALAAASPATAAPPFPEEWLRARPDARGPLEKADPRLLAPAAAGEEDLEVLATLRLPAEALALGAGSPRAGARTALQARLAGELETDYAPFGVRVEQAFAYVPVLVLRAPRKAVAALAGDPRIERVRPNGRVRALDAEGEGLMRVPELRAAGVDGAGVTIAVLDSGIDYTHPELPLGTKVVNLYDAIDHDGDARDGYGHGTPVAGIIAGLTTGVARGAKVAAVRVLDTRGEGSDAQVLEGVDAVLASVAEGNPHAIRVVNLSLGGYFDDAAPPEPGRCDLLAPDYKAAFDLLAQAGILVVAASGNGGCTGGIVLPACVSNALAVGAVYDAAVSPQAFGRGHCLPSGCSDSAPAADAIACYSDSGDRLDVLAPAHCATAPRNGGGSYSCFGGTSAAAPYAAGVAALLFGAGPDRRPTEVKAALRETGKAILDPRNGVTRNRIDAPAALAALRSAPAGAARAELLVPVVLDVVGVGEARFRSELTLTNRGTTAARLEATYTPATGMFPGAAGGGTVADALAPGEQRVIPDAIAWLRAAKGLPIPLGPGQAGSLRLVFTGLSPAAETVSARVRTTAAACGGAAGLSYAAWKLGEGPAAPLRLFGLRSGPAERSNLAVVNMGTEGTVTPRIILRSGDGASVYEVPAALLPPLAPGEWRQVNDADLLRAAGFAEATALVSRAAGTAPLGAYAVFNDNLSHDGSFVPAVPDAFAGELVLPVVVETPAFESELVLFNPEAAPAVVSLAYTESLATPKGRVGAVSIELAPFEQRILPRALDTLRDLGLPLGPRGAASYAGTLQALFASPTTTLVPGLAGAKTSAAGTGACAGNGSFGLFYTAVPTASAASVEAVVDGLRQTATTRSNLALFNPSATVPVTVAYDVHDGATGAKVSSSAPVDLPPLGWTQVDRVLLGAGVTEGFVRVRRTSSAGVFGAYGVLNDGAAPGERTGDGSYVAGEAYDPPD
ncbi:MAG TPA: S8 family serine peptidase [Thermoanaerobaculia bacterium]|nr:S8 family serine peptidase [Thermoanaerobaculia bacterium]